MTSPYLERPLRRLDDALRDLAGDRPQDPETGGDGPTARQPGGAHDMDAATDLRQQDQPDRSEERMRSVKAAVRRIAYPFERSASAMADIIRKRPCDGHGGAGEDVDVLV